MGETRKIAVASEADVWTFTQRNVPLWDILEFFPPDAIGPRGPGDRAAPLRGEADRDRDRSRLVVHDRHPVRRLGVPPARAETARHDALVPERGLEPGDAIVFEKAGERRYALRLRAGLSGETRSTRPAGGPERAHPVGHVAAGICSRISCVSGNRPSFFFEKISLPSSIDLELPAGSLDERGFDAAGLLDLGRQTGGPGKIVSLHAVGDLDLSWRPPWS